MSSTMFSAALAKLSKLDIGGIIGSIYGIYQDQRNWRKIAPSKKKELDYEDEIADENADEAFRKQKEFQEMYLTPEAQIKSQAAGFDAIGMNRMMLAGGAPGTSSTSAPQAQVSGASGNPSISDVLGPLLEFSRLQVDKDLRDYQNKTERINAETNKFRAQTEAFLTREKWRGEQIRNKYLNEKESASLSGMLLTNAKTVSERYQIEANTNKVLADTEYQKILTRYAPRLFESQIKEKESLSVLNYARSREVEMLTIKHSHEIAQIDVLRDKLSAEATWILTRDSLTTREIEESEARVKKINAEIEKIGKDIGLSELDLQYYDWNHPRSTSFAGFKTNDSYRPSRVW